jgi:hypothetical protein
MQKYLSLLFVAALGLGMQQAQAQDTTTTTAAKHKAHKTAKKKTTAKKKVASPKSTATSTDEDDIVPDVKTSKAVEFNCELGNKVTIYQNNNDPKHIAMRWKNQLHRLTRVDTTTGADRFENHKYGLLWIDIPAKGMLLDSKHGHQLANECKDSNK